MADDVTLPVLTSTVISTDEVDLGSGPAHVSHGKIISAEEGGTNRLRVSERGGMYVNTPFVYWESPMGTAVASAAYSAGEQVGDTIDFGEMPEGHLLDLAVSIANFDLVNPPTDLHFFILPADVAIIDGTTLGLDGDPFGAGWPTFGLYDKIEMLEGEFTETIYGQPYLLRGRKPVGWRQPWARHSVVGSSTGNVHAYGFFVAGAGGVSTDYTAGLTVSATARFAPAEFFPVDV